MGRLKIELDEDDYSQVHALAREGLNVDQIASKLGMSKKTLERRLAEDSDAKDALERGRAHADGAVISAAFEMAKSGKCPSMTMFWLRARCGWREEVAVEPIAVRLAYSLD